MFGSLIKGVIGVAADIVSPVTELVGLDKTRVVSLLALGWTIYEISEVTGIAADVIEQIRSEN